MSLGIPGCSANHEVFSHTELIHEPDYHEAIAPIGHERGTSPGFFAATPRVCAAEQTLGLLMGDLDTPAMAGPSDGLRIGSCNIDVEENRVRVIAARISDHHGRFGLRIGVPPQFVAKPSMAGTPMIFKGIIRN